MLGNVEIKTPKKFILGAVVVLAIVWGLDYYTGFLTTIHLRNEETIAIKHGQDSVLYKSMVDELISDTRKHEFWERKLAAVELGHLGPGAARAIPALEALLDDEVEAVRVASAIALARIGDYTVKAVPPLVEVLKHSRDHDKFVALQSLGIIGKSAHAAVPAITRLLQSAQPDLRRAAKMALEGIGTPEALAVLPP